MSHEVGVALSSVHAPSHSFLPSFISSIYCQPYLLLESHPLSIHLLTHNTFNQLLSPTQCTITLPLPTSPTSPLHSNRQQPHLRTTTRNPTRDEEKLPEELRDTVPPIASCRVQSAETTLKKPTQTRKHQAKEVHIPNQP